MQKDLPHTRPDGNPTQGPEPPEGPPVAWWARFFFLKSIFAILLSLLLIVSGVLSYRSIVKEAAPDLAIPQATVQTEWPGADPETVEKEITNKLEKNLKSIKGLKRLRSASFNSFSVIAVEFRAEADLNESMQLLREKVREAEPDLPGSAKKPKIEAVSVDDTPMFTVVLYGDLDPAVLARAAENVKRKLERAPGVRKVELAGKRKEVVHIQMIPERLAALGISPTLVRDAVQSANLDMPWDRIESEEFGTTVRLQGRFREVEDLQDLPVARPSPERVVRLGEIARIRRDLEREKSRVAVSWQSDPFQKAVDVSLLKTPGADTLKVIGGVKEILEQCRLSPDWPYCLQYAVTSDQSIFIWDRLLDVFNNGWQAMLCVFIVLFFMLSWREALIAGLSIPLTFLGSLTVIGALGYSLNEMVIIGMVLALGLLVDVFILMMEGIHEGIFVEGLKFNEAALKTVKTYAMPAFSGQMTTILAMAPLFGIGGVDGKFIRIIPVATITCLVVSYFVALLVDVPLSRFLLGSAKSGYQKTRVDVITAKLSGRMCAWSLDKTLRNRKSALFSTMIPVALFFLSAYAMSLLPSMLYPVADGRNLGVAVELPPTTTLDTCQRVADGVGDILRGKDYLQSVVQFTGQKSPLSRNSIGESLTPFEDSYLLGFSCIFTPREERDRLAFYYLDSLRQELADYLRAYPGSLLVFTAETGGPSTEDPLQIELTGEGMDQLRENATRVKAALRNVRGVVDIRDNLGPTRPDIKLLPDREALNFYNLTHEDFAYQVRFAMTDDEIGKFPLEGLDEDLEIRLSMAWPSRLGAPGGPTRAEELAVLKAFSQDGQPVPLLSVVEPVFDDAPLSITHKDGQRSVNVMGKLENRTVGEMLTEFQPVMEKIKTVWSTGYDYHFGGEAESAAETYASAGNMFFVAIFLVFALLALQFGSFTQPFIILLSLPFALIGTFAGFFLAWIPFSFPAIIGIISLVGIVVNDAIVMIEAMNAHRESGLSVRESAARGAADRLRPIVSTSITTIVGLTPLALSNPMWMPLCNAIIFGLLAATVISLLIIPCLYLLLTREHKTVGSEVAAGS